MSATLTYKGDSSGTVQAAGEFSNWQPVDMNYVNDEWLLILDGLEAGKSYQYKFIINGQWGLDPNAASVDDGNGNLNHSVTAIEKPAPIEEKATEPEPPSTTAAPIDAVASPTQTSTAPQPTVSEPEPIPDSTQTQSAPVVTEPTSISAAKVSSTESDKITPVTPVPEPVAPPVEEVDDKEPAVLPAPVVTAAPSAKEQQPSTPNPVTAEKLPGPGKTSELPTESSNKDTAAVTSPTDTTTAAGSNPAPVAPSDKNTTPAPGARPAAAAPAPTGASSSSSGTAKTLRGDGNTPQKKRGFFKRLFG